MTRYLVTGCAGFIGSHLDRVAARRRPRRRRRRLLQRQLRARRQAREPRARAQTGTTSSSSRATSPRRRSTSSGRESTSSSTSPASPACARAGATRFETLHPQQRRSPRSACSRRPAPPRASVRLRLLVVDLRRRRARSPRREDATPRAALALRRDQAGRRAPVRALPGELRRRHRRAALLHRLRPAPAPGHGVPAASADAALDGEPIDGLRRRRARPATSPLCATSSRPPAPLRRPRCRRPVYNIGGGAQVSLAQALS